MPIIGTRSAWAIALAAARPDTHPGEEAGPDVDGDHADLVEFDVGLTQQELDRRHEGLDVSSTLGDLEQPDDALVATDGDADALGGGLDAEDQHA